MLFQSDYTMGRIVRHEDDYHYKAIRNQLTRTIDALTPTVYDEVRESFEEIFDDQLDYESEQPLGDGYRSD
jgi:hypothetical protein